jgi:hypothetical protein
MKRLCPGRPPGGPAWAADPPSHEQAVAGHEVLHRRVCDHERLRDDALVAAGKRDRLQWIFGS